MDQARGRDTPVHPRGHDHRGRVGRGILDVGQRHLLQGWEVDRALPHGQAAPPRRSVTLRHYARGEFGPLCLEAVQQHLVGEGKARTYVNHLVQVIKQAFKWGVAKELVPVAVHQALATLPGLKQGRTAARETEPVGPVPDAVVDDTILCLPIVVGDMAMVQRLTGCRPGELMAMRPGDIDRSGEIWTYRPAHHK